MQTRGSNPDNGEIKTSNACLLFAHPAFLHCGTEATETPVRNGDKPHGRSTSDEASGAPF